MKMARGNEMKIDSSLTQSVDLSGELFDVEQFERDLRAQGARR